MSLSDIAPATKRARDSVAHSFMKFLKDGDVSWEYLKGSICCKSAALVLEAVVDKFGMYLAHNGGRKGQIRAQYAIPLAGHELVA
ncbi:hypothetical protein PC129_g6744 [Phytophthora cactorum]|uniref:Uncharacterized protein n=1 Tax=Phytophthora cactorum TaxID=29920 RepID=A0A329SFU7_9STRA|nr:hypothetical protein Pcac1_g1788 [Phytophthora cactorum]KAG2828272.1 hypothetical protein PC112_g8521 [Phytophthora cactorum]KAG2829839.1 hypothetical protein PC111_g7593 [Phytophthora cactorum]KAG2859278.1 hypothetical protein PC113_g9061 [Phytophthora cactorum]KAG2911104.1 hypothetical protein PC114_g9487 [Phytophthora cactorum]